MLFFSDISVTNFNFKKYWQLKACKVSVLCRMCITTAKKSMLDTEAHELTHGIRDRLVVLSTPVWSINTSVVLTDRGGTFRVLRVLFTWVLPYGVVFSIETFNWIFIVMECIIKQSLCINVLTLWVIESNVYILSVESRTQELCNSPRD